MCRDIKHRLTIKYAQYQITCVMGPYIIYALLKPDVLKAHNNTYIPF